MKMLCAALVAWMVLIAVPTLGQAQEDRVYTIALYAPDILFGDAVSRASFVQSVASQLTSRTGYRFQGKSFARGVGAGVDYAILGGTHYASNGGGKLVAYASGSASLALMVRPGSVSGVHQLRGKTLILPRSGKLLEGFVTGAVLGGEIRARDFFKVTYTKDVGSALAAVKRGQADATLAFAPYAGQSGLQALFTGAKAPFPVVVQVNRDLDAEVASKIAGAWKGLSVSGGGLISGFGGGGGGFKGFRGASGMSKRKKKPEMSDGRMLRLKFPPIQQSESKEAFGTTGSEDLVPTPELPKEKE